MNGVTLQLLILSIVCSTVRTVFSKKLGTVNSNRHNFYITQALLFAVAAIAILILNIRSTGQLTEATVFLSLLYGVFTVLSQWMYTIALVKTSVSICAMVYSFGFIIPTVFGTVIWHERVNAFKIISILLCICTVILASVNKDRNYQKSNGLPLTLIIAMISSGGLGIVQKFHQKSAARDEAMMLLFIAFVFAAFLSLAAAIINYKKSAQKIHINSFFVFQITIVGVSMAAANIANTVLAGLLPSAVVFPIVNVGVIVASLGVSVIILREKINKIQFIAFALGIVAILLLNL